MEKYGLESIPAENVGFEIIAKIMTGPSEAVVLGKKPGCEHYVSWTWSAAGNFYWGHYSNDRNSAYREFLSRARVQCCVH